jgi:DNA-binding CsgD family transcriptional regulator
MDAVGALLAAGEEALAREDPLAAERFVAPLLEQPLPDDVRREADAALALAEAAAGRPTALTRLQRALADERVPAARARPLRAMCRLHFARGEFAAAAACAREAYEAVGPDHPLAATFVAERIACARFAPESAEPEVLAMRARLLQDGLAGKLPDDPALLAQVATGLAIGGAPAAQVAAIADAAFGPVVHDAAGWDGLTLAYLAAAAVYTEDVSRAERAIAELDRLAIGRGSTLPWTHARHWRAELRFRQGRLEEAVVDAQASVEMARDGWAFYSANAGALLTRAHVARGDLNAARGSQALADAADEHALFGDFVHLARAELLLAEGRPAEALATLEDVGRGCAERSSSNSAWLPWRPQAVLAAMALGDRGRAVALAADELEEARRIGLQGRIGAALRVQALATEDVEARTALMEEAVRALEPAIDRLELARALADLGALHARRGRMGDAREPLIRGAALAQECAALPLADHLQAVLAAAGARGDRDALTPTERQIAQLAAEGMTNRQIAGRLVITPKTVEWHLTNAYAKLGVSSRRELADALARPVG